ncbi:hypothetical protein LX73_1519 [Fodinibius salinus]|uniref:Tetratricopeptide repeat-containing protein n=1 Tax=Fodinibius salinus TaxID=860790 RepID=A0A5D3YLM1_9BACT|nr:hypothetical protein [Fodinibius salinus]TYP93806.1 hypothetical protein LX73_1519 [Fodinibius salinus]
MTDLRPYLLSFLSCFLFLWGSVSAQNTTDDQLKLGSIDFPTSATGKAQQEFLTGVLALHSFWYPEARDHFKKARKLDPAFAMAYWGELMTYDHPIWGQHNQSAGSKVLEQLDHQIESGKINWTEREKAYINAIRILYDDNKNMSKRRSEYAQAMQSLYEKFPSDETLAFSALASMTTPDYDYSNPDPDKLVPIAAKLEQLYKRNPKHPGGMHYLIHIYDNSTFAEMGIRPANDYSDVAYSSSHAIHMPSHIFKQLKMWDKVIQSNIRAYDASVNWQQKTDRPLKDRDYHSYRWLFEAYLEVEDFKKACNIIKNMQHIKKQAKENGEELGRIPGALKDFQNQYNDKGKAPTCSSS